MPAPYTFQSAVLSAAKSSAPLQTATLSANGVNIISLSTNDVGLAYNPQTNLTGTLTQITVDGSVFKIDNSYHNQQIALNKVLVNNLHYYNVFTHLSSGAPVTFETTTQVSTPNGRRMRHMGYR